MPLPAPNTPWPPTQMADINQSHAEWDAWYDGAPSKLRAYYQKNTGRNTNRTRPSQHAGGVQGALARFWWGKPVTNASPREQLHIPIARDIARTSASLLYADPPTLTADNTETMDRLAEYVDDGFHNELATSAEVGAALGARYMRVTWDQDIMPDRPFITTVHADDAIPTFRYGHLVALSIVTVVHEDANTVRRWIEHHETVAGVGLVFHALYEGTQTNLGRVIPLTENPTTAPLAPLVGPDGALTLGRTPGLNVVHVPNMLPAPHWRHHPIGRYLGISDFDAVTGLMDALDETWSSWMRDIRVGKARVLASEEMFDTHSDGGYSFDYDREVFELVSGVLPDDKNQMPIEQIEFTIRVGEHSQSATEITRQIIEQSGYSLNSFGDQTEDADITATEVRAREKKSMGLRDRKIRYERPALAALTRKLLAVDRAVFNTPGISPDTDITVEFADAVQESPEAIARTVSMLRSARVISIETGVRMAHPDWDDPQVTEEVTKIMNDDALADPTGTYPDGATDTESE